MERASATAGSWICSMYVAQAMRLDPSRICTRRTRTEVTLLLKLLMAECVTAARCSRSRPPDE